MLKVLIITVSILIVLALILSAGAYIMVQRTFTPVNGVVYLKGLKSEVKIYRDKFLLPT